MESVEERMANKTEPWERVMLQQVQRCDPNDGLEEAIVSEKLLVCSYGGHIDCRGSFGWCIGTNEKNLWEGKGEVTGEPMSSFRAEGGAQLSALTFLNHYITYHNIDKSSKPYSDGIV